MVSLPLTLARRRPWFSLPPTTPPSLHSCQMVSIDIFPYVSLPQASWGGRLRTWARDRTGAGPGPGTGQGICKTLHMKKSPYAYVLDMPCHALSISLYFLLVSWDAIVVLNNYFLSIPWNWETDS